MPKQNADQCVTVRLPQGVADELRARTGRPISTLLRLMAVELLNRERSKAQGVAAPTLNQAIMQDISNLPD